MITHRSVQSNDSASSGGTAEKNEKLSGLPMERGNFRTLTLSECHSLWNLTPELLEEARLTERAADYPMYVSEHFARLIQEEREAVQREGLLLQVLPSQGELRESLYFTTNPLEEQAPTAKFFEPIFLLQKYSGRALLMCAMECFGNCRFCFRRHLRTKFLSQDLRKENYAESLNQVSNDSSIHEIILSGGDPLTLEDDLFFWILDEFSKIEHLKRIRVHTRAAVFAPEKFSENFLKNLKLFTEKSGKPFYLVVHVNHPAELSPETESVLVQLHAAGAVLLQQGVLLRGINDRTEILAELYERLANLRVIPYYLHQLDRVAGAVHFEVPEEEGRRIISELRGILPGYAVPRYVREIPGENGKTPLD